jgi:uncharacterized protein (DUF885 family)
MSFQKLTNEILEYIWKSDPVNATIMGIHKYDSKLNDLSKASVKKDIKQHKIYIKKLEKFKNVLKNSDELDYKVILGNLKTSLLFYEKIKFFERNASYYSATAVYGVYFLILRDFAPLEKRAKDVINRLKLIPKFFDEGISKLKSGKNIPRVWTETGIEVTEGGLDFFKNVVPQFAEQTPALKDKIIKQNISAISATEKFLNFLKNELLLRSNGDYSIGEQNFNFILKHKHLLPYKANDLLKIGNAEIEKTLKELEKVAKQINPEKSWEEIIEYAKSDYPPKDNLLDYYKKEMMRIKEFVRSKDLVTIPENEELRVIETPVFERPVIPYAAYMPPAPFEKKQEGFFWVTPVDGNIPEEEQVKQLRDQNIYEIVSTVAHEAYPGHHLQLIHSNRIKSKVRRFFETPTFAEGWALYVEELMNEHGLYNDPKMRLLQLKGQLWRACRVVIDVKLHTKKMTFDSAVDMLVNISKAERPNAVTEVKRYVQTPTQPMSYIIGKMQILKLREELVNKSDGKFTLKDFHDKLLSYGTIPIELIRRDMFFEEKSN